jgi:hypothetical protein
VLEVLLAGLLGAAILWMVLRPLLLGPVEAGVVEPDEFTEPEESVQGRALLALKEIEFDRATGKLSDQDFEQLTAKYERAAVAALDSCTRCGMLLGTEARFCNECGMKRREA